MPQDPATLLGLAAAVLVAAVLYSSVGHAGASGYLAALALFGVAPEVMRPAALAMNILVATVTTWRFASADLVPWRLLVPLAAGSIPAAFFGGAISLPTSLHRIVLGGVLLFAAFRLGATSGAPVAVTKSPRAAALVAIGAVLGLLSGLTGVGGGIFLSPLLLLARWEETRRTAGASAAFILLNSIAGLLGFVSGGQAVPAEAWLLGPVALAGGVYGSGLGARRLPAPTLRRLLALVLLVAGLKLLA